ncbi:unnamed protein product [Orchesella dallaii]|uniref:C2H2-type domain-containing protein n=1 Tax=Orchesella dallaii TaxID=48710 RepID=A0ABP1QYJ2_9HEXA
MEDKHILRLSRTCLICDNNYYIQPKIDLSELPSSSKETGQLHNETDRIRRALELYCELSGLPQEFSITSLPFSTIGSSNILTKGGGTEVEGTKTAVHREVGVVGTEPPCCNECKSALLKVLSLEEIIIQNRISQRKQVESLTESLMKKPTVNSPIEMSMNENGEHQFWSQIRNRLISGLDSGIFIEIEDENSYIKPEVQISLLPPAEIPKKKENSFVRTSAVNSCSSVTQTKRKRGRPIKQPFENLLQHPDPLPQKKLKISESDSSLLKKHDVKPCSIVLERLKGRGNDKCGRGDGGNESMLRCNEKVTQSTYVAAKGDSSLGVRRSKLKAYKIIRESVRFSDVDCERTSGDEDDDDDEVNAINDDFIPDNNDNGDADDFEHYESSGSDNGGNNYETRTNTVRKKVKRKKKVPKTNQTRVKPVRMLRDRLLIFRSITIKYTYGVNFMCQARGCSTIVKGTDYFAFQAIKAHISDNHTNEKGFVYSMPRACPLCNNIFKGCKKLNEHLNQEHKPIYTVCEVCWRPLCPESIRPHAWLHKSEEEKAVALAAGEPTTYKLRAKAERHFVAKKVDNRKRTKNNRGDAKAAKISERKKPVASPQPLVMSIAPELLLFKNTLIKNTGGSLKCQGIQCNTIVPGTDYDSLQQIKDHVISFHSKDAIISICPLCDVELKKFLKRDRLPSIRRHLLERHSSKYVCECCWKPIKSSVSLRRHVWSHRNAEEKAIAEAAGEKEDWIVKNLETKKRLAVEIRCPVEECGKTFYTKHHYKSHEITHLPKELRKQFDCPECGLKLLSPRAVRSHIERQHKPELANRPKICPICDKRFHYRDGERFRTHVRSHKGERPFQCHICGMSFFAQNQLKRHGNVHNPASRVFQCEFCAMSYKYQSNLKRHRLTAHVDKVGPRDPEVVLKNTALEYRPDFIGPKIAYPCDYCDKVFPLRSRMTKHVKMVHQSEVIFPDQPNVNDDNDDVKNEFYEFEDSVEFSI